MILRKYRKSGFGTAAAVAAFNLYQANWKVAQMSANEPAIGFWRKVIKEYTNDTFTEVYRKNLHKYVQAFSNRL
ncbi:hypothetical protein D3C73_1412180 [compost metagenome]